MYLVGERCVELGVQQGVVQVKHESELALSKQGLLQLLPLLPPVILANRDPVEVLERQPPAVRRRARLLVNGCAASERMGALSRAGKTSAVACWAQARRPSHCVPVCTHSM